MKKLALAAFAALATVIGFGQGGPISSEQTKKKPIQTLVVDKQSLPFDDRVLITGADMLSQEIDSGKSLKVYRSDTTVYQGGSQTKASYAIFYNQAAGISKIETSFQSNVQDVHYVFYFRLGKPMKIVSGNFEEPAFKSTVYFAGSKSFFPKDFSESTVVQAKKDAGTLYDFFRKELMGKNLLK